MNEYIPVSESEILDRDIVTPVCARGESQHIKLPSNPHQKKSQKRLVLLGIIGCLGLFLLAAIAVIITLSVLYSKCTSNTQTDTSELFGLTTDTDSSRTKSGSEAAVEFLTRGLDTTIDPCQDFYKFSCGNWSKNTRMPPGHRYYDELTSQQHRVIEQLYTSFRSLKDDKSLLASQPRAVRTAKAVFDSCVQVVGIKYTNLNPLLNLMTNSVVGIWPLLLTNWKSHQSKLSVSGMAGLMAGVFGVPSFITPVFTVDWANVSLNRLFIDEATLTLGTPKMYMNYSQSILDDYADTIKAAARILANDAKTAVPITLDADVLDIVKFETKLAHISVEHGDYGDDYNPMHIFTLKTEYPGIDWDNYFYRMMPADVYNNLFPFTQVIIMQPEYMKSLSNLLQRTPKKVLYDYLIWRIVHSRLWVLSAEFRLLDRKLKEKVDLRWAAPSHSVECIGVTTKYLGFAVGRLFVDSSLNMTTSKPILSETIEDIRGAFKQLFLRNSWLDMTGKERALRKLEDVQINTAYPEWIMNDQKLDEHYRNLTVKSKDSFFTTLNKLVKWSQDEKSYDLLKTVDRSDYWGESPALVNACNMKAPLVRDDYPSPLIFGAFGTIVGHELMHGFDDQGINFGPTGQLGTWLDLSSTRGFRRMSSCLANDYGRFCYKDVGMCVDGAMTNSENMADVAGLEAAFLAYRKLNPDTERSDLRTLESFTNDQLFFLSYANVWCSAGEQSPEVSRQLLMLNPHPPNQVRVLGALRNFAQFGKAFDCPSRSAMSSIRPCSVW